MPASERARRRQFGAKILFCLLLLTSAILISLTFNVLNKRDRRSREFNQLQMRNAASDSTHRLLITPLSFLKHRVPHSDQLIVVIASHYSNVQHRVSIRRSWASSTLDYFFVLGRASNKFDKNLVNEEAKHYSDLLVVDIEETYSNLTRKLFTAWLFLAQTLHAAAEVNLHKLFVMKTDDDVLLNVPLLTQYIIGKLPNDAVRHFMIGYVIRSAIPVRNITSRYYVSPEQLPVLVQRYPDYLSGTGYLFSASMLAWFVECFRRSSLPSSKQARSAKYYLPSSNFPLEDVYFTGFCRQMHSNKIELVDAHTQFGFETRLLSACLLRNVIVAHLSNVDQLISIWSKVQSSSLKC